MSTAEAGHKVLVVGDVHMDFGALNTLINKKQPDIVLQVGDFGYWPRASPEDIYGRSNTKYRKLPTPRSWDAPVYWIDGNHEDFDELWARSTNELWPNVFYMPRGSTMVLPDGRRVLFIGGAASHDKEWRTAGWSWFPQELITQEDLDNIDYSLKYDIVISHTSPASFGMREMLGYERMEHDPSEQALDIVFEKTRPALWFFGHWHRNKAGSTDGTRWHILDHSAGQGAWWMWLPD